MADNHRSVIGEITHGTYQCREAGELARASSEKQKRHRVARSVHFSTPVPGAQRKRIACHKGRSVTSLIKEWAASAERRITHHLSDKALTQFYDSE
jgi:hypothetical protein